VHQNKDQDSSQEEFREQNSNLENFKQLMRSSFDAWTKEGG